MGSAKHATIGVKINHYSNGNIFPENAGVMLPVYDRKAGKIKTWKVTNSLQTRRIMAQMMIDRFKQLAGGGSV